MGRRRCCCEESCILADDTFTYQDGTVVPGWEEKSGDWAVYCYWLKEAGTSGAWILNNATNPFPGKIYVSAMAVNPNIGDKYRIILDSDGTSINHYAEFTVGSSTWTVDLYDNGSLLGSIEMLPNLPFYEAACEGYGSDEKYTIAACIGDGSFWASTQRIDEEFAWVTETSYAGDRFGLGNGGSSTIYFDDFFAATLTVDNIWCFACRCPCKKKILPKILTLTFSNCTGRAACLEGVTATLTWTWHGSDGTWDGSVTAGGNDWDFVLKCSSMDPTQPDGYNIDLTLDNANPCPDKFVWDTADAGSTCVPLNLIYGGSRTHYFDNLACTICGCAPADDPDGPPPGGCDAEGTWDYVVTE